jgi:Ni,Fe-hydrogenase III large subunit
VFESIEYLVCTIGEDIEWVRPHALFKHRGLQARFEGASLDDAVLLAERTEGVASVAHAVAFSQAVEQLTGCDVPVPAALVRVIHAELERVANHLESTIRHTEAAGQAVAYATLSQHKEQVQRLRAQLCGSRFGRSVVVPGGVAAPPRLERDDLRRAVDVLARVIATDMGMLLDTPSFIDRLRGTGVLPLDLVRRFGALGPVARGSGALDDVRVTRPYGAYPMLGRLLVEYPLDGDALARQYVRVREIEMSFHLIRQAAEELAGFTSTSEVSWRRSVELVDGEAPGWVEAPQGELLYDVESENGIIRFVKSRSASFHNLALFASAFPKDVFTDFAFIEASFGVSIAGVAS